MSIPFKKIPVNQITDITINNPISSQLYGTTPPDFNLSILDSDLNARWFSLDGSTTNIPFSGLTGTIDQTEWARLETERQLLLPM